MEEKLFQTFPGDRVTDSMLGEAAKLFNENYGIWGKLSHSPGKHDAMSFITPADAPSKENPSGSARVVCGSNTCPTTLLQATCGWPWMGILLEMLSRAVGNTARRTFAGLLSWLLTVDSVSVDLRARC